MGLFRKSIKHSKSSKDLDNKIKNLDEDLKKTGVTINESDALPLSEEKVEDVRYDWRKDLYEENTVKEDLTEEYVSEIKEKHRKLALVEDSLESIKIREAQSIFRELYQDQVEQVVEKYVSSNSADIVTLREDLFLELNKKPNVDLSSLEEKIDLLAIKYRKLSEGLLNDPSKNSDPLSQNPVTLEQLKNHYQLLVGRLQEQLATLGGGGEVRLEFLDDVDRTTAKTDGYFLQYQASTGKWIGAVGSGGGVVGSAGTWGVDSVGINTVKNVGIGTTAKDGYKLYVEGDVRVTGIVTIGSSSITLDGDNNEIQVGSGVTLYGNTGIISATAFYANGEQVGGAQGTTGAQGITGANGTQGLTGTQGAIGAQGTDGAQGVQGTQGTDGAYASIGAQGANGTQGIQGIQGITGAGTQGTTGAQGITGNDGQNGSFGGATFDYTFSTDTTNSDPGVGKLKFDNSTPASITEIYIDDQDDNTLDIQTFLRTIDDSTSTIKGHFKVSNKFATDTFLLFTIDGSSAEETGYFRIPCTQVSGNASFSNGEDVIITFARTGDRGDQGIQGADGAQGIQGAIGDGYFVETNIGGGLTGIHTTSNVGVGTTNPQSILQVQRYGVETGFIEHTSQVGVKSDIDSFDTSSVNFLTAEYTVHVGYGTYIQSQKVLIMHNSEYAYAQEYGVMYQPDIVVSFGATMSGNTVTLQATPETGVSGITTYRFVRGTML